MNGKRSWLALALLAAVMLGVGCGGGGDEGVAPERSAELTALEGQRDALAAKRAELREVRAQVKAMESGEVPAAEAAAEGGEGAEGAEGAEEAEPPPTLEELQARVKTLEAEELELAEEYGGGLVTFINANPPIQGEEWPEDFAQAWALKVDEDMFLAQEAIDKGGDYRRAIGILETLGSVDPENQEVQAALAQAEADRFMTAERLEQVKNGMTRDEVRQLIGQVNLYNIKEYEDKGVLAWLYPREDKGAAGVYFNQKGDTWRVYQVDFDAVKPPEEG